MKKRRLENVMPEPPQRFKNMDTDEEFMLQSVSHGSDRNFHKVFFRAFKEALKDVRNQKLELVLWIIEHMSWKNELKYSYRELAEETGISYQTVATTMKSLIDSGFLIKRKSDIIVNPNVVFRGKHDKRTHAWNNYMDMKEKTGEDEAERARRRKEREAARQEGKGEGQEAPKGENGKEADGGGDHGEKPDV